MGENAQRERVLLVEPEDEVVDAAAAVGLEVRSVPAEESGQSSVRTEGGDALRSLLRDRAVEYGIEHILYFGRSEAVQRAVEAALVDLSPRRAEVVRRLGDPVAMRRILNESRVSVVSAMPAESTDGVRALAERCALPLVVKRGSDPRAVTVVRDRADLDEWTAGAQAGPYLVEEFLTGPEVSVETLTCAGMHEVVGMTALRSAAPAGADLLYPAPLSDADRAGVRATVRSLLDLVGYESGLAHTQVVLTESGPRIASARARPSGPAVRLLMRVATGRHPGEDVLAALAGRTPRKPDAARFAALATLALPAGGPEPAARLDGVRTLAHVREVGVVDTEAGSGGRAVRLVVDGASPEEVAERLTAVRRQWDG
ncbi:acetyl-CoA carboxylase biotin carboxylase subunit family protein [Streptomyces sp. NPDC049627]|uniref:acetyl-CoA carboxylase biotin carboxylase subunit family protein n=1 Tax=Streptomyces sp. NPDC049627 TaxID=3365595 RepID=UPI0037B0AB05